MKINFVWLVKGAIFLMVITVILIVITSKTDKIYGLQSFVVLTGSMGPSVPQGSVIFTQKNNNYQKGEVVAFRQGNITVTHRIVQSLKNNAFITKGDANNANDSKAVSQKDILGKQILYIPYLGYLITLLKTVLGFLALVVLPSLVLIGIEIRTIVAEIRKSAVEAVQQNQQLI